VAKESMVHILSHRGGGHGAVVVTGGAREALYSQPNTQVVYIKDRKGFVKVAIQTGYNSNSWTRFNFSPTVVIGIGL